MAKLGKKYLLLVIFNQRSWFWINKQVQILCSSLKAWHLSMIIKVRYIFIAKIFTDVIWFLGMIWSRPDTGSNNFPKPDCYYVGWWPQQWPLGNPGPGSCLWCHCRKSLGWSQLLITKERYETRERSDMTLDLFCNMIMLPFLRIRFWFFWNKHKRIVLNVMRSESRKGVWF